MQKSYWKSRTFRFWIVCYLIVLMVPLVSGVTLYRYTVDTLTRKAYDSGLNAVRQVRDVVDEQLSTIGNINDTICVSSGLVRLKYYSLPFDAAMYYEVHQRAKYLSNFAAQGDLIRYLYVYCNELGCLLDSGHIYTDANQMQKIISQRVQLDEERFETLMNESHQHDFLVLRDTVLMLQTLGTRGSEKQPVLTLITVLNVDSMRALLRDTGENNSGSAYMLLPDGSVLGDCADGDPVDYAALSERLGEGQVTDRELVVTFADSCVTPFRFVLSVPCSSFLSEISRANAVFLIGAGVALLLGLLIAYMLAQHNYKPLRKLGQAAQISEGAKDEFSALGSRLEELLSADDRMQSEIEQLSRVANAQLFSSLLTGDLARLEKHQRRQLESIFTGNVFVAALFTPEDDAPDPQPLSERLGAAAAECAGSACRCLVQPYNGALCMILCFARNTDHNDAQFLAQQLCYDLLSKTPVAMTACIGDARDGAEAICLSYRNACKAREYAEFVADSDRPVVLYDETMYSSDVSWQDYDIVDAERQFTSLMLEGNYSRGEQVLRDILAYYHCHDGMSLYVMRCRMFGVMNMMLNVLHEVEPDLGTSFYEETNPVARLLSARTMQELEDVVFDIVDRLVGQQESKTPDMQNKLAQIEHYIAAHYFDVGLGVKQIADAFGISLPYLSRVFKKEKGVGLLSYINAYRIQKAKELLALDPEATITEIAEKVGYNSSQTLIRIFKRYEGTTPGQFRTGSPEA